MSYSVILQNKYDLSPLVENISLIDSLDQIAYMATISLVVTPDFPVIAPGDEIRISGIPYGSVGSKVPLLNPGVVWETSSTASTAKHISITVYDRTIYLAKSEDECLFAANTTAAQRLRKHASNWGIKLAEVPDTEISLKRAMYRPQTIYSMIQADLRETAKGGGELYVPRMTAAGLSLVKIAGNEPVWKLEAIEEITQSRTLEEAATRVKVLGTETNSGEAPAKVLAIADGQTAEYGVLQIIVQEDDVKTASAAKRLAQSKLRGVGTTYSVTCPDLNTLRAGDKVILNGTALIAVSVTHQLGDPGKMSLELAVFEDVKRRYYL
ncbi:hypothetical protein J41TS12_07150 [Paenibacillus antibioticophila]|uniref:YqbQ/XkdQ domain-containing protein n=1 Tax=Paenibacillus antibioticophila TaxID=1274374 RepID=A0A919XN73_9BACL|nr:phage portal protein [Paenibacillus antibioticophila]GIO35854.1 hypothetical protein J41TS12_07150 [Paenibacillus antibioticophila]